MAERIHCPACGQPGAGAFCAFCGQALPAPVPATTPSRLPLIVGTAIGVVVALVVGIAVVSTRSGKTSDGTDLASDTTIPVSLEPELTTALAPTTTVAVGAVVVAPPPAPPRYQYTPPPPPPAYVRTTVACPTGQADGQITSFYVTSHDAGSNYYHARVDGSVTNNASASVRVSYVEYVFYNSGGTQVDNGTSYLSRTLAPGESAAFTESEIIYSQGGDPVSAQVTKVQSDWSDSAYYAC